MARFFQLSALLTGICQGFSNYSGFFQLFALVATFFFALLAMFFFAHVFPIICQGFLLCWPIICLVGDVFPSICLVGRFSKYLLARFFPIRGLVGNVFPCWHVFPLPKYLPCWLFALVATFSQLFSDSSSIEPIGCFPGRSVTPSIFNSKTQKAASKSTLREESYPSAPMSSRRPQSAPMGKSTQRVSPSLNCPNGPPIINPLVSTYPHKFL